jgi:hypothetical protein
MTKARFGSVRSSQKESSIDETPNVPDGLALGAQVGAGQRWQSLKRRWTAIVLPSARSR